MVVLRIESPAAAAAARAKALRGLGVEGAQAREGSWCDVPSLVADADPAGEPVGPFWDAAVELFVLKEQCGSAWPPQQRTNRPAYEKVSPAPSPSLRGPRARAAQPRVASLFVPAVVQSTPQDAPREVQQRRSGGGGRGGGAAHRAFQEARPLASLSRALRPSLAKVPAP